MTTLQQDQSSVPIDTDVTLRGMAKRVADLALECETLRGVAEPALRECADLRERLRLAMDRIAAMEGRNQGVSPAPDGGSARP